MAVARQERCGLPVNVEYLAQLVAHWERLQLYFIARDDEFETVRRHIVSRAAHVGPDREE